MCSALIASLSLGLSTLHTLPNKLVAAAAGFRSIELHDDDCRTMI